MNTNSTAFTDKASYLAWRAQWKADYAALSSLIRDMKWARWFDRSHCAKSEAQQARFKALSKAHTGKHGFHPIGECLKLRARATAMLEVRKESKVKAQEQYLASKPAASVRMKIVQAGSAVA